MDEVARSRRRTRSSRWLRPGLVAAVLFVAALLGVQGSPAVADTGTYVRLAQLAPDTTGVAMTVTSAADPSRTVMLPAVGYGGVSDYQRLEPGDYVVAIKSAQGGTPTVTSALKAVPGASYTLAAVGEKTTTGLSILTDDLTPPPAGSGRLRIVSAASDPVIDVRNGAGSPFALGLAPGQASPYRTIGAGPAALSVGAPGAAATPLTVDVAANQVVTAVVVSRGDMLAVVPHVDAAGPVAVPPGPVDAGFGGAAQERGLLPEVLLGSLAVAAACLSLAQARRQRGRAARRGGTC